MVMQLKISTLHGYVGLGLKFSSWLHKTYLNMFKGSLCLLQGAKGGHRANTTEESLTSFPTVMLLGL